MTMTDTTTATRDDPRYVTSTDQRAVLRAWGGESPQHATMDMGGWTDTDAHAFRSAIQDESTTMAGEPLDYIVIVSVERS